MAQPSSRSTLIDYCKRQLGAPLLEINIADEQTEDLLDDAIQYFQERHFNGVIQTFLKYKIRQLKEISSNPIAVGFGISSPEHIIKVRKWGADGVIIGSAFVKRISDSNDSQIVNEVGKFCSEMRSAADEIID